MYTSEVHEDCRDDGNTYISRYKLNLMSTSISRSIDNNQDNDNVDHNDGILYKNRKYMNNTIQITMKHRVSTCIEDVGYQVWSASFLLSEYLLHIQKQLQDSILIELGSVSGLLAVIATLLPIKSFHCTDYKEEILHLAKENIALNRHLAYNLNLSVPVTIDVKLFDWAHPIKNKSDLFSSWIIGCNCIEPCVFLAADVIYDDKITRLFFTSLAYIMNNNDVLLLTLEKRYNFSIDDMDLIAHGYFYFISFITGKIVSNGGTFVGELVNISKIPRSFNFIRSSNLELWRIKFVQMK
jgi:predicted nicotinamide N-methyase